MINDNNKHTELKVNKITFTKVRKFPGKNTVNFFPEQPITKKKFIDTIRNISNSQVFSLKNIDEVIFVIETYDEISLNTIEEIIEKKLNCKFILFLTENEFLVRCAKEILQTLINKYNNKKLPKYLMKSIKQIRSLDSSEKISSLLLEKMKNNDMKNITGLLVPGFKEDEYDELIKKLIKFFPKSDIIKSNYMTSSVLTFNALVDNNTLKSIAEIPFVFLISEPPEVDIVFNQIKSSTKKESINIVNKERPEICVIDSGIETNILPSLISIEDGHPSLNGNFLFSEIHGTEVSSVAAYGDDLVFTSQIPNQTDFCCNIISYKLADKKISDPIFSCVYDAVNKYKSRTRIYNLSVSFKNHDALAKYLTNEIDKLVQTQNVILVNSTGNISMDQIIYILNKGFKYPHYLTKFACQNPSNGKNVFSVSSFALYDNKSSICFKNQISPYSAIGKPPEILDDRNKPELFAVGGNLEYINSQILKSGNLGIPVISTNGAIKKQNGTSFSAPYISHVFAHLDKLYSPKNSETLKAILLSCCNFNNNQLKLLAKRDEICFSNNNHIICYAEDNLKLPLWDKAIKLFQCEKATIRFYVPIGTKEIRIVLVHSDNNHYATNWMNNTKLTVDIYKGGKQHKLSQQDSEIWFINKNSQVQFVVFNYQKAHTGDWYITIQPSAYLIRKSLKSSINIRYGLSINLLIDNAVNTNALEEITEKLRM